MLSSLTLAFAATFLQSPADPAPGPVRLVVLVVVDQLPPDQIRRLGDWWEGGFARFHEQGWRFPRAAFEHGRTETGPGHATIGTGFHPTSHGLVSNNWTEVDAKTVTYCVYDAAVRALTVDGPQADPPFRYEGRSTAHMRVPALGDYLKAHDEQSQVVAISSKDRGAVPIAGRAGDWALWWDRRAATGFMSSTAYGEALPDWVARWNAGWLERLARGPFRAGWRSSLPADEGFAASRTGLDDRPGEHGTSTFPHTLPALSEPPTKKERVRLAKAVYSGPAGDDFVLDLAQTALTALALGADDHVDLLSVSLSSCDTVGHSYGPLSREVTDVLLRADRKLGALFEQIDERVGAERWVAVLTADHGVLGLPETLAQRGLPAERDPSAGLARALEAVSSKLTGAYGEDFGVRWAGRGLRLSAERLAAVGADAPAARALARDTLREAGADFVAYAWTADELRDAAVRPQRGDFEDEAARVLRTESASFFAGRTPDVVYTPHRYHLVGVSAGTSHGSPWPYDREVPLVFLGPGFPTGVDARRAGPVDIVPTLLRRLGIEPPAGLDGAALEVP